MLDKIEPPIIPDGYGISIAYACLLEIIRSLQITIGLQQQSDCQNIMPPPKETNKELHCQLINSSWCGLLAALSPLVEASMDEAITENILKSIQTYASLCGVLDLHTPRDAFITAICKSSLPPHYALTVLNTVTPGGNLRGMLLCYKSSLCKCLVLLVFKVLCTFEVLCAFKVLCVFKVLFLGLLFLFSA